MAQELVDTTCYTIAAFIQDKINTYAAEAHGFQLIKTIRDFDDGNIPLNDYPCLRVSRTSDVFTFNSFKTYTSINIKYSVVVKIGYKPSQILSQVGRMVHDLIGKVPDLTVDETRRPTGRINIMSGTNQEAIGHYLYDFYIIESSVPEYTASVNFI